MAKRVFRSKKKISGRCLYRAWKEWEVGDVFIGKYSGSKIDNYDKPNWLFEIVDIQFADKKEAKRLPVGERIGLNSMGMLNKAMEQVEEGDLVQVTYNGMAEIDDGGKFDGKDAHTCEVEIVVEEGDESGEDEDSGDDL